MKIIRHTEVEVQNRPDGRTVARLNKLDTGMNFSTLQFLYVTHPPKLKEDLHCHERSYEALYFLDRAQYRINGVDYDIYENDLVIFEPGDIHGAIPVEHEVRIIVFQAPAINDDKKVFKE